MATDNITVNGTLANVTGRTINSLAIRNPGGATYVSLNTASDTLTLGSGGLLLNDAQTKGINFAGGNLTAGTSSAAATLYLYSNVNTPTIYSAITNNTAGGGVSVVKSGAGNLTLTGELTMATTTGWASGAGSISVPSTTGLFAGETIGGGNGLTAGATIVSFSGNSVNMSLNTSGSTGAGTWMVFSPAQVVSTETAGSNQLTLGLASTQGWTPGMAVGGSGIPAATTITGITSVSGSTYTVTLSNNATANGSPTLSYGAQSNSYSGTTYVDQGQLNLNGQLGAVLIPGNLVLNGWNVTMNTNRARSRPRAT